MLKSIQKVPAFARKVVNPKSYFDESTLRLEELRNLLGFTREKKSNHLVNKDGSLNVTFRQLTWANPLSLDHAVHYSWVTIIWFMAAFFLFSWCIFGFIYWSVEYLDGNTCHDGPYQGCKQGNATLYARRCVVGLYDYSSALQFSLETMSTVGFGARSLSVSHLRCYVVLVIVIVQSMTGMVLVGLFTGILINKFKHTGPSAKTVTFSPKAVVQERDKSLFLVVMIHSNKKIYGASVKGFIIFESVTEEGDINRQSFKSVPFGMEKASEVSDTFVHVMWPVMVSHEISRTSTLFKFNPANENFGHFEVIILLKGTTANGEPILSRTSYIRSEIVWGGRFITEDLLHQRPPSFISVVEESQLFRIEEVEFKATSAETFEEDKEHEEEMRTCVRISNQVQGIPNG